MRRELTQSELLEITALAKRGDRLGAISLYISATEAGLTDAQNFIRALTAKAGEDSEQKEEKRADPPAGCREGLSLTCSSGALADGNCREQTSH
jgi:hypothetical protein